MLCPCHSQKTYESCCKLFHDHTALPSTPEMLMRSRYSAYARAKSDYIIETTHPKSSHYNRNLAQFKDEVLEFSKNTEFLGLEILEHSYEKDQGRVVFHATLKQGDQDISFKEKSLFIKELGRWYYLEGTVN